MDQDIQTWGTNQGLSDQIINILEDQGYTSAAKLKNLTPGKIAELFKDSGTEQLIQIRQLKRVINILNEGSSLKKSGCTAPETITGGVSSMKMSKGAEFGQSKIQWSNAGGSSSWKPVSTDDRKQGAEFGQSKTQWSSGGWTGGSSSWKPVSTDDRKQGAVSSQASSFGSEFAPSADTFHKPSSSSDASDNDDAIRILLLGKTGNGKSSTGNTILGQKLFDSATTFASVTSECDRKTSIRGKRKIEVMDSPGLFDTKMTAEDICKTIVQSVAGMHPGPHAILFVIRIGRYTAEEHSAYERLKALFDNSIAEYMILLFTWGDALEKENKTIEELLYQNSTKDLQTVLQECNGRYAVFNNFSTDKEPQVESLFKQIKSLAAKNGGKPYACPKYFTVGENIEEEVKRRVQEVEKRDLKRQKVFKELEEKEEKARQELQQTKIEHEKRENERQRKEKQEEEKRKRRENEILNEVKMQEELGNQQREQMKKIQKEKQDLHQKMEEELEMMAKREEQRKQEEEERRKRQEELFNKQKEETARIQKSMGDKLDMMTEREEQRKRAEEEIKKHKELLEEQKRQEEERRRQEEEKRKAAAEKEKKIQEELDRAQKQLEKEMREQEKKMADEKRRVEKKRERLEKERRDAEDEIRRQRQREEEERMRQERELERRRREQEEERERQERRRRELETAERERYKQNIVEDPGFFASVKNVGKSIWKGFKSLF